MIHEDIAFVESILPNHYAVQESKKKGSIHCKSDIGLRLTPYLNEYSGNMVTDAEDEEHWGYVFGAIKKHFGERFQEVFHNTCFCHVDFTVYLKPDPVDAAIELYEECSKLTQKKRRVSLSEIMAEA